ncbi:MAG: CHASE4 domain-containing protein [Candidatus Micrarchaeia archaeon]
MNVYGKVISLVGISLAVMLFATLFIAQNVLTKDYLASEQSGKMDQLRLAKAEIEYRYSSLDVITAAIAAWDETYQYMLDRNRRYYDTNLVDQNFRSLNVNVIAYYDPDGNLVEGKAFDVGKNASAVLPAELESPGKGSPVLEDNAKGIEMLGGRPYLVSAHAIVRSDGSGEPRGTLVIARALDPDAMCSTQKIRGNMVTGYAYYNDSMPAGFLEAREYFKANPAMDYYYPQQASDETLTAYARISGIDGRPAMIIGVDSPREAYKNYKQSMLYLILSYMIMGIVEITVLIVAMDKVILCRLKSLSEYAKNARNMHSPEAELAMGTQKDEISELFSAVAEMNRRHRKDAEGIGREKTKYEELVEEVPIPTIVFGGGRAIFANEAVGQLGYEPAEVVGKSADMFMPARHRKRVRGKGWKEGRKWACKSVPIRTRGGEERLIDLNLMNILFEGRQATLCVGVDITEKKKAQEMLRHNARKLEEQVRQRTRQWENENRKVIELLKVKDNFIREISHELKTPLAVVAGNVEMLKNFKTVERQNDYDEMMALVRRNCDRLRVAVNHILDTNKISVTKASMENFDIAKLARDTCAARSGEAISRRITCQLKGKRTMVRADRKMMALAIGNLLANAFKATSNAKVGIKVYSKDGHAFVEVSDAGQGISIESRRKLSHGDAMGAGMGIGFAAVESIMLKHNGKVFAKSKAGKGNTFTLMIPLRGDMA